MRKLKVIALITVFTLAMLSGCKKEPEKTYKNEVTGAMMNESLKDQRPVAIVLGVGETAPDSNIIYEYTLKDGTKRLALIKDWGNLKEIKTLGDSDQTAEQIAPAWNAVLIANTEPSGSLPYLDGIATEKIKGSSIKKLLKDKDISETYNEFHTGGDNLTFEEDCDMSALSGAIECKGFTVGSGAYTYDEESKKYKNEAGEEFKNVILQNAVFLGYDNDDFYNLNDSNRDGWFIREGYAAPVTWAKLVDVEPTKFYDTDGQEIKLSEGNTLITIVSDADWDNIKVK